MQCSVPTVLVCLDLAGDYQMHASYVAKSRMEGVCTCRVPCLAQPLCRPHICSSDTASSIDKAGANSRLSGLA